VKKPERIVALSLVMVLCLLVYRLAEQRLHAQLAAARQTVLNQLKQPTQRPTTRWMLPPFEGISVVQVQPPNSPPQSDIAGLEPLNVQVVSLLGASCATPYTVTG
jgi:hypothetical protein